jgi:serine/threonine protein kinase
MSKVQANAVGTKIGQYTIIKHLASTRNSHVFLVNDEQLQKPLVLKLFAAEQNAQNLPDQSSTRQSNQHFTSKNTQYLQAEKEQFLLQAKLLFEFDSHQSIVKVMHVGQYACEDAPDIVLPYIVMPCYTQSLDQLLALHQQKLSFSTSFKIIQDLLSALIALHAKDVLHLDIKPQNVFLDEQNLPYLGDFGNALVMTASPLVSKLSSHLPSVDGTSTNTSIGVSASYASPELKAHWTESQQYQPSSDASESKGINSATNTTENITSPLSHQSDLYALGALWFRMLTGHSAYQHIKLSHIVG